MAENFDLIFGQNASQQYAWSDTDYQNGWGTIGNIPPTAAQFDALQRRADTKMKELNDELTPLVNANTTDNRQPATEYSEGTIKYTPLLPTGWFLLCTTGGISSASDLVITSPAIGDTVTDGTVTWTIRKGASTADIPAPVDISGKANVSLNNLSAAGEAKIRSVSRYLTDSYYNASTGDWWRKYSDGWVEQGGFLNVASNASTMTMSLLKPMIDTNYNILLTRLYNATIAPSSISGTITALNTTVKTTTSFKFIGYQHGVYWHVVGKGA